LSGKFSASLPANIGAITVKAVTMRMAHSRLARVIEAAISLHGSRWQLPSPNISVTVITAISHDHCFPTTAPSDGRRCTHLLRAAEWRPPFFVKCAFLKQQSRRRPTPDGFYVPCSWTASVRLSNRGREATPSSRPSVQRGTPQSEAKNNKVRAVVLKRSL